MQVWLYEADGAFEFRYSPNTLLVPQFGSPSGIVGYEASGALDDFFGNLLPCSSNEICDHVDYNADLAGRVIRVERGRDPDLTLEYKDFIRGALPGNPAQGTVVVLNRGTETATASVQVDLYLSTNDTLNRTQDILVGTFDLANIANGRTERQVTITVPSTIATGDYFLIGEVDVSNAVDEAFENNNIVVSPQRFATAFDLNFFDCVVTNPGGVNPGQTMNIEVTMRNNGAPYTAGPLEVNVFVSEDNLFDGADPAVPPQPMIVPATELPAANTVTFVVQGTMPSVNPGLYYPIVQIDPAFKVTETNENNNLGTCRTQFQSGSDFGITGLSFNQLLPRRDEPRRRDDVGLPRGAGGP
ncbi:MAG: hypothetical protein HC923_06580 [Myxococcales bacterium]|nr:hypothetical protein [Myxococcales bacterium]